LLKFIEDHIVLIALWLLNLQRLGLSLGWHNVIQRRKDRVARLKRGHCLMIYMVFQKVII